MSELEPHEECRRLRDILRTLLTNPCADSLERLGFQVHEGNGWSDAEMASWNKSAAEWPAVVAKAREAAGVQRFPPYARAFVGLTREAPQRRPAARSYAALGIHPADDDDIPVYMGSGDPEDADEDNDPMMSHVGCDFEFHNHDGCEYSWGPHFHGPCKDIWHVPPLDEGVRNPLECFCPRREWKAAKP